MSKNNVSALIVAQPGRLRDGMQALMRAVPRIKYVNQVDDGPSAVTEIAEHTPSLVLLDTDLPDDAAWKTLQQIKTGWPEILCILIAGTDWQRKEAKASGADAVLVKGFTLATLAETIAQLVPPTAEMRGVD